MKVISKYKLSKVERKFYNKHHRFLEDGRHVGNIAEDWVCEVLNGVRQHEKCSFDVLTENNEKVEVRSCISKVSFAASKEVGYGRQVTDKGFQDKLDNLDYFVIIDSRNVQDGYVNLIKVTKEDITNLDLGKTKSMSANKFFKKVYNGDK